MDKYNEWRKTENVRSVVLPNKEKFYADLMNIKHSWSGRVDMWGFGNTFIMEAEQLLINAIELFEAGYFDCAYYSLRSAIEISTTIVFLSDMPDNERETFVEAWKETKEFPMQGQMLKQLSEKGNVFADMKEKMSDFFIGAKQLIADLHKYVHKQGFQNFYISRNHPINRNKPQDNFIKNFEYYLQKCIGIVAVMRLAIDPFPVILADEEILYRCMDSMTEPYNDNFVDEYIGENILNQYKTTEIYQDAYNFFINNEKKSAAVFNVTNYEYIDSTKMDELLEQLHLMSKTDVISVLMVYACDKIVKIYGYSGMHWYFTEKETNRKEQSWSSLHFKEFEKSEEKINQCYGEAYISVFTFENESYCAEHNEMLNSEDIAQICGIVTGALFKMDNP